MTRTRATVVVIAAWILPVTSRAAPTPDRTADAHGAYARGAAASDAGEYAAAAAEFARADSLVPNNTALELALKAVVLSDDALLAMTLAQRADARKESRSVGEAAAAARAKFAMRIGQLRVLCPSACTARVDGVDVDIGHARWVTAGDHRVEIAMSGSTEPLDIHVGGGEIRDARPTDRAVSGSPRPRLAATLFEKPSQVPARGVTPVVFWSAVGVTAALGAATVGSALDTRATHDAFLSSPSGSLETRGHAGEARTNALVVTTAVAAVATAALGLFVRW